MEFETPLEMEEAAATQTPLPIKIIGTLLLILAAAAILFFLYRKLAGNAASWKQNAAGSIYRSPDEDNPNQSRRPSFPGMRRNVRYYYRKFLQLCIKNGLNTERPLTSGDAHKFAVSSAACQDPETSREFRDLYRRVRYGGEPEDEDTGKRAKELYQSFR